jgi:RNA polymerase sigma-70 factor (ECF subfamily)
MAKRNEPSAEVRKATTDWPAVWETHRRWLRTAVWSRLGEGQAVDDVLQEVALAAAKGLSAVRDPSKVGPWLYRVAIRQSLLYRRRAGRRRRLEERFAVTQGERNQTCEPLGWLLAQEERELVRRALRRLPDRDTEILMLKYTEDWTYRDLAEHLGVSVPAVEARLHRARKRMRAALTSLDPSLQPAYSN